MKKNDIIVKDNGLEFLVLEIERKEDLVSNFINYVTVISLSDINDRLRIFVYTDSELDREITREFTNDDRNKLIRNLVDRLTDEDKSNNELNRQILKQRVNKSLFPVKVDVANKLLKLKESFGTIKNDTIVSTEDMSRENIYNEDENRKIINLELAVKELQDGLNLAISSTPTGEIRNKLTEYNITAMSYLLNNEQNHNGDVYK